MEWEQEGTFDQVFREATGFEPFAYQRILATGPELPSLIRVPTGAGKTAGVVLAWLYRRRFHPHLEVRRATPRRLVYCLPMRVLVEQTLQNTRKWIEQLDLAGEVGVYQLMGGAVEDDWVRHLERDAILVGTIDMLLSRALNRGYAAARSRWPLEFGLLNNDCLWVLDEVQLMGNGLAASAQLAAFRTRFGTVRPCPSLWMSATIDRSWLETVDHDPPCAELTLGQDDLRGELGRRVRARKVLSALDPDGWPDGPATVRRVLELHRPGTLSLVVANTVERARRLYAALRRAAPAELEVQLLHSRFRPPDRRRAVEAALAQLPPDGRIVVATQVVEAGVDLSAATLVTELAPWGSLVQRFGRCNRFGELPEAAVWWVDLRSERDARPYDPEELEEARDRLRGLEGSSVGPAGLEKLGPGAPPRTRHVVRRLDLLDLFDTEPDLAGNDVDVSRFIRDDADVDVHVFWRRWSGDEPPSDLGRPTPEELCPVPVWEVREFLGGGRGRKQAREAFVWDHLGARWRRAAGDELHPGMVVLLPSDAGGYTADAGWDPGATDPVPTVEPAAAVAEEAFDDEPPEEVAGAWLRLDEHLGHVRDRVAALVTGLGAHLEAWQHDALLAAALWHDVGKAHEVFQDALLRTAPAAEREARAGILWAKSARGQGRLAYRRPHFRHELASALAILQTPRELHGLTDRALDLAAYLAAAHHGKVRLAIRALRGEDRPPDADRRFARGVWEGDELGPIPLDGTQIPALRLDLSVMEVGRGPDGRPSWAERVLRLRDALGPFRLAFLETLLRVADWQASAEEVNGA